MLFMPATLACMDSQRTLFSACLSFPAPSSIHVHATHCGITRLPRTKNVAASNCGRQAAFPCAARSSPAVKHYLSLAGRMRWRTSTLISTGPQDAAKASLRWKRQNLIHPSCVCCSLATMSPNAVVFFAAVAGARTQHHCYGGIALRRSVRLAWDFFFWLCFIYAVLL